VDPYWTIISGVLSRGRGRSKPTLARYRLSGSPLPGTSRERRCPSAWRREEPPRKRPSATGFEPVLRLWKGADWLYHIVITNSGRTAMACEEPLRTRGCTVLVPRVLTPKLSNKVRRCWERSANVAGLCFQANRKRTRIRSAVKPGLESPRGQVPGPCRRSRHRPRDQIHSLEEFLAFLLELLCEQRRRVEPRLL